MASHRVEPLSVGIVDGRLVISIGVETLAGAIKLAPCLARYNEATEEYEEPEITDPGVFVSEIVQALNRESEDGTTMVHLMLDRAGMEAIEQGAEGVWVPGCGPRLEQTLSITSPTSEG